MMMADGARTVEWRHCEAHKCPAEGDAGQREATSRRAPFVREGGGHALPAGCARGEPVVTGVPSVALPAGGKELFNVLMSFVERDDYYAVLELARRAGDAIGFTRKCGFTVALRPEGNSIVASFPEQLCVCEANLLHYAICISSFRAAIALLVVCPAMLHARCKVIATNPANYRIAAQLYSEAAQAGSRDALWHLGYMYWRGHGVEKDGSKAMQLFRDAGFQSKHAALTGLEATVFGAMRTLYEGRVLIAITAMAVLVMVTGGAQNLGAMQAQPQEWDEGDDDSLDDFDDEE